MFRESYIGWFGFESDFNDHAVLTPPAMVRDTRTGFHRQINVWNKLAGKKNP